MCGICGIVHFSGKQTVSVELLQRMTHTMSHRGPDDQGLYTDRYVGLGHRRLSIIDLGGGHQPMSTSDGSLWVVFNGEIYNFNALRTELQANGHEFKTNCDTEVILYGYKQWGLDVLTRLHGMFGFALWDKDNEQLVLARDRLGIKLVYYTIESGTLYFGSEIRPVREALGHKTSLDPIAWNLFLKYRYTPSPLTVFDGIRKLAPGTCLVIHHGESSVKRYDRFSPEQFHPMPSLEEAEEHLLSLYRKAVRAQLMSDVPLGLLLSGGLDSGLLLALMHENGNSWRTYTVGFGTSYRDDELSDAAGTARILNSPNDAVCLDRGMFEKTLSGIVSFLEEPVASPSIVPMYHVCQRAREDVKVALCGQGPDELFSGYTRHLGVRYGHYWRALPDWIRATFAGILRELPRADTIKRALYSLDVPDRLSRYQQVFSIMQGEIIDGLFQPGILSQDCGKQIQECWADLIPLLQNTDELGGFNFLEIRSSLPDELLMYADKLSMAHSLETRVPYLDEDIVEFVEGLDCSFKVRWGTRKFLHRRVCQRYLPKEITSRKKKGFAVNVVDDWFSSAITGKLDGTLLDTKSEIYKLLSYTAVKELLQQHQCGARDNHKILFSLVIMEEWMRSFLN